MALRVGAVARSNDPKAFEPDPVVAREWLAMVMIGEKDRLGDAGGERPADHDALGLVVEVLAVEALRDDHGVISVILGDLLGRNLPRFQVEREG